MLIFKKNSFVSTKKCIPSDQPSISKNMIFFNETKNKALKNAFFVWFCFGFYHNTIIDNTGPKTNP